VTERSLVVATRRSLLALSQTRAVVAELVRCHPGLSVEELPVVTSGDRITDRPLLEVGGKGLFVKEIEEALLDGRADFAVHSLKDMPASPAQGLELCCIPLRADPRDAVVTRDGRPLAEQPTSARVGTTSLRRRIQLGEWRPDLSFQMLRGNVDTRIKRCEEGRVEAIVLAQAGLLRLGWAARATEVLSTELCLPAVGQGALALECRVGDQAVSRALLALDDRTTALAVAAERAVMRALGGGCDVPLGALGECLGSQLRLRAVYAVRQGGTVVRAERVAPWPREIEEAESEGTHLGRELLQKAC
jgi:hydroxymethylbilane synthase